MTSAASPLPKKQRIASAGVLTIGSPATLNDVFSTAETPVASAKHEIRRWYSGFAFGQTTCDRAVPSTCTTAGMSARALSDAGTTNSMYGDEPSPGK